MNRDGTAHEPQWRRALELRDAYYLFLAKLAFRAGCTEDESRSVANASIAALMSYEADPGNEPIDNERAWLAGTARNKAYEAFRQRLPHHEEFQDDTWALSRRVVSPEGYVELLETLRALRDLDDKDREAVVLAAIGYSMKEIAATFGSTESAVKQRVSRARKILAAKVDGYSTTRRSTTAPGRTE